MPFDRELLAAIRHFCLKLEGRELFILTDHKPLCHALGRLLVPWSACQQQHLTYISKLTQDIQHVPGKDNVLANALSLPPQLSCLAHANLPHFLNTKALSAAEMLCSARAALASYQCFHVTKRHLASGHVLLFSTSTSVDRPLLLPKFRRLAFDALHTLSHPGVRGFCRLLTSRFLLHEQGCWSLGFKLPGLPEDKGGKTCAPAGLLHRRTFSRLLTCPRRLGGPPAINLRFHSHLQHRGLFYALACHLPRPGYFC